MTPTLPQGRDLGYAMPCFTDMTDPNPILALTKELIACRSTDDRPDQIAKALRILKDYLKDTDFTLQTPDFQGHPCLVATRGTQTPEIFLCGHLDVVEGDDGQFRPRLEGNRLYGRGALDMKSGVAVMATILKELEGADERVGLMITTDEETGGFNGTNMLLEQGFSCKAAILPDGGMAYHRLVQKAKGVLWVEFKAIGKAAHSSMPWQGENAIQKLIQGIDQVQTYFKTVEPSSDDHWTTTCSLSQMHGGEATNQVPESAVARCDIRYTEDLPPDEILRELRNRLPDGVSAECVVCAPIAYTRLDDPYVQRFMQAVREQGREPEMTMDHGSSDARFFSERGIPVIICQPDGQGHHGPDEWVSIQGIKDYYEMVKRFLVTL